MAEFAFDPQCAVTFDLGSGSVSLRDSSRQLLVPLAPLGDLLQAAGSDATRSFARAIGSDMATRISKRIAQHSIACESVTASAFIDQVRGEFAVLGLGTVHAETWGQALMFVANHSGFSADFVAAVLQGLVQSFSSKTVTCPLVFRDGDTSRVLVVAPDTETQVNHWINEGVSWHDIIARLHIASACSGEES